MPLYIADCDVPGITPEQVRDLAARARTVCEEAAAQGAGVRYLRILWIPEDWRAMLLFRAESAELVRAACRGARIPLLRVVEGGEVCGT